MELCSRTGEEFTCESICITAVVRAVVASQVAIVVRVAIDDFVIAAELIVWIELGCAGWQRLCLLDAEVLVHAYLQACVVVVVEDASLNYVV